MKVLAVVMVCLVIVVGIIAYGLNLRDRLIAELGSSIGEAFRNAQPDYRLTNCTRNGGKLLEAAFAGHVGSWESDSLDDGSMSFGVSKPDWNEAKATLHRLEKSHPKEFSKEADAPTERESLGMGQVAGATEKR